MVARSSDFTEDHRQSEVGKAQRPQLRKLRYALIFYFETLWTKVFKNCCAFNIFFGRAQFYTLNLILFHFDRNIDKRRPSLANYLPFLCHNPKKFGIYIVV